MRENGQTVFDGNQNDGVYMSDGHKSIYAINHNEIMETAFVCCDCGLVHLVEIEHSQDAVAITWHRSPDGTEQLRDNASQMRATVCSKEWVKDKFSTLRQPKEPQQ